MTKLLGGALLGAALVWLFDPESGEERRASLRRMLGMDEAPEMEEQIEAVPASIAAST